MSARTRLGKIEKQLVAAGVPELARGCSADIKNILHPSPEYWMAACESIAATMPAEYVRLLEADFERLKDLDLPLNDYHERDHYSEMPGNHIGKPHPAPLTQRFFELVELRVYQCPRPLVLPEPFCRALTEIGPGQWLSFGGNDC